MLDWEFLEGDLPDAAELDSGGGPRRRWRLGLVVVLLVLAASATFGWLRWRADQKAAAMREDLRAAVREELYAQSAGLRHRVDELADPNAPETWLQRYTSTFGTGRAFESVAALHDLELLEVVPGGRCALVILQWPAESRAGKQARYYCTGGGGWRRTPVPANVWGPEQGPIRLTEQVRLRYRSRDAEFAAALTEDLKGMLADAAAWTPGGAGLDRDRALNIVIEPDDLGHPVKVYGDPLELNSPLLIQDPGYTDRETALRLAVADTVLRLSGLDPSAETSKLPGAARFAAAIRSVAAVHLALSSTERDAFVAAWREELDGRWVSPFLVGLGSVAHNRLFHHAPAAARLTVEYLYLTRGPQALAQIVDRLDDVESWDAIFNPLLGRPTATLEREAAAFAADGLSAAAEVRSSERLVPIAPPYQATFMRLTEETDRVQVTIRGVDEAVWVELPDYVVFRAPDGAEVTPACLGLGAKLEIEGRWLEVQRRLEARYVGVQRMSPVGPPVNLLAHVAPDDAVGIVAAGYPWATHTVYAVEPNGSRVTLVDLDTPARVRTTGWSTQNSPAELGSELTRRGGRIPHLLIETAPPGCDRTWVIDYAPEWGRTRAFLSPPHAEQWVWDHERAEPVFFQRLPDRERYRVYRSGAGVFPEPAGEVPAYDRFLGWHAPTGHLVFAHSTEKTAFAGLLDLETGDVTPFSLQDAPPHTLRLSPDGRYLAYLVRAGRPFGAPDTLRALDLTTREDRAVISVGTREGLTRPAWLAGGPGLAVLSGPAVEHDLWAMRLLVGSAVDPDAQQLVADVGPASTSSAAVGCADPSIGARTNATLLFSAQRGGRYELHRQIPGARSVALLTSEQPLWPLACMEPDL